MTELVLLGAGLAHGSLSHTSTRLYDIVVVGAAVVCAVHTATRKTDRLAWGLMAVALAFWAFGELYYDIVLAPAASVPIPSVSDIFWLAFYLPAYAALVLLARSRPSRTSPPPLLARRPDRRARGLVGLRGRRSSTRCCATPTGHSASSSPASPTRSATSCCSPLLVSVAVASAQALADPRLAPARAGFAIFCVGDSVYLVQTANGTYQANSAARRDVATRARPDRAAAPGAQAGRAADRDAARRTASSRRSRSACSRSAS